MNTNTMKWLLRREFWENKGGFFWAPVIAGIVFLAINLMAIGVGLATAERSHITLGSLKLDGALASADAQALSAAGTGVDLALLMIATLIMCITAIVVFFYSIGALYDERRDRSILFWKSLPISDTSTVVSKVLAATVLAPAIGIGAGIATALLFLLVFCTAALFVGHNFFGIVFSIAHPLKVGAVLLAALPVSALWALPTVGWLMLCSVAARSKPFLWAVALPIGAGVIVSWFDLMRSIALPDVWFWKYIVARLLFSVAPGSWTFYDLERFANMEDSPESVAALISFGEVYSVLGRADLWIGAAAGIAMLVLATRLRRWRDDG